MVATQMKCQLCKAFLMRRCKRCGQVWCTQCASKGKGHYPLLKDKNRCPYCGYMGTERV